MSTNALLSWMSARREGSWQQFRTAVEELRLGESDGPGGEDEDAAGPSSLSLYQTLRFNLQRMGHAEFFAGAARSDWRVTPPCLAVTQHARGWLGIFVGARSLNLLDRLHVAVESSSVSMETLVIPAYPDQILVIAKTKDAVAAVAKHAGIISQFDAPAALLMSLPPIDDKCVRHPVELPFGSAWRVERFSPENLVWKSALLDDAASASAGLFRFSLRHQTQVLFCVSSSAFKIPGQVGKYLVLKTKKGRRQVLSYHRLQRTLVVPAIFRPPFLVERALILCSGSPPTYEDGNLRYTEIPENIAALAATLLRQEIR